jgi:KilA-N domain
MMNQVEVYEGKQIEMQDGYLDGTALCQANGKRFSHWHENEEVQELKEEIASDTGIPVSEIVRKGRQHQHSFVHPLLWPSLGQWCSRKCAIWVNKLLMGRYRTEFHHALYGEPIPIEELPEPRQLDLEGIVLGEVSSQADALKHELLAALEEPAREFHDACEDMAEQIESLAVDARVHFRALLEPITAIRDFLARAMPRVIPRAPREIRCLCHLPSRPRRRHRPNYNCPIHSPRLL